MINLGEENVEEVGEKYENETFKDEQENIIIIFFTLLQYQNTEHSGADF